MSDNQDQNESSQKNTRKSLMTKALIAFSVLASLAIISIIFAYGYLNNEINKKINYAEESQKYRVTIKKGMSTDEISKKFYEDNIISNPYVLKVFLFLNPNKKIQAGYYQIDMTNITLISFLDEFQKGSFQQKLTFIEGWRKEEYYDYLKKEISTDFADKFIESPSIKEGYMFPDTYIVDTNIKPEELASWMRNTFKKKVNEDIYNKALLRGISEDDLIIIASIVEREMHIKKDKPIVAGILIKRLSEGWPLQADATIQYAKGNSNDWWPIVTRDDYRNFESPFNTYTNKGLPPGPICNPSLSSIEAVANYTESPYWFYISAPNGNTYYAKTIEEHNQNVAKYLK